MNEKTTKQIEEMMNQTIGVEVEMNNITRKPRRLPPISSAHTATKIPQAATVTAPTPHGTARDASGSSRRTSAFTDRTAKSAN